MTYNVFGGTLNLAQSVNLKTVKMSQSSDQGPAALLYSYNVTSHWSLSMRVQSSTLV